MEPAILETGRRWGFQYNREGGLDSIGPGLLERGLNGVVPSGPCSRIAQREDGDVVLLSRAGGEPVHRPDDAFHDR